MVLHLYYHAMLLSLNRHFVRPSAGFPRSESSREVCVSSTGIIATLIRQYRFQHGLHAAPLMLVYALVMAIITHLHTLASGREGLAFLVRGTGLNVCVWIMGVYSMELSCLSGLYRPPPRNQSLADPGSLTFLSKALDGFVLRMETIIIIAWRWCAKMRESMPALR